jgi:membrane protein DedA with SNARE-associated domain
MIARLFDLVIHYGVAVVFLNVFLEQIGAPIPAIPTLIVAGALTRNGQMSSGHTLIAALVACLIADYAWFLLGRRFGYRVLQTLCRVSLSPDSCVRETESRFEAWGLKSLLIAKFIPGFSTVAPPLAGAGRRSTAAFLIYDAIGSLIWAGAAVAVGRAFHKAIGRALDHLENLGGWALIIVSIALALFVFIKWMERRRFLNRLRVARITVDDLKEMFDRGEFPVVMDVRTPGGRKRNPLRIPEAIVASATDLDTVVAGISPTEEIVLYCT